MTLSFAEVMLLLALGLVGWLWWDTIKAREIGIQAARDSCRREQVQLLDDTVVCRSLRLARNDMGQATLRRVYDFEYSDSGNDRYRGSVMLLGREVMILDISEHRARGWVM